MDELYEVRIRGALDDAGKVHLTESVRSFGVTETVMRASIADDAELRGFLARLEELDCELLAARRVGPYGRADRPSSQG